MQNGRDLKSVTHYFYRTTAGSALWYLPSEMVNNPMDYTHIITIEPGKRSGQPCVRGMRIMVYDVLGSLASGMTEDEITTDFPDLTRDDIRACLAFAADSECRISRAR